MQKLQVFEDILMHVANIIPVTLIVTAIESSCLRWTPLRLNVLLNINTISWI